MAKRPSTKPPKLTRAEKKAARAERARSRRETWSSMRQAFTMTRKNDAKLIPLLILTFVGVAGVIYLLGALFSGHYFLPIPIAVLFGLVATMYLFSRRAQGAAYAQADGQPGAALYVLKNLRGNDWTTTEAVAGTAQFDAVHRLTGRPGVVLVGEGAPHRVKGLIAQEKRKLSRLVGDAPIYDVIVGAGEGETSLRKLNAHLLKLPRNLSKDQVSALNRRLTALGTARAPLPKGAHARRGQDAQRPAQRSSAQQLSPNLDPPAPDGPGRPTDALALPASGPGAKAPAGRRLAAFVIDAVASAAIAGLFVRRRDESGLAAHLPGYWSSIPLALDYLVGLTLVGQTLGMRLVSLRVVRTDRPVPIGLARAAGRTLLLFLFIPALIFDRANRGLHDRVSDTVVIRA